VFASSEESIGIFGTDRVETAKQLSNCQLVSEDIFLIILTAIFLIFSIPKF
jgi:hypothetical protein